MRTVDEIKRDLDQSRSAFKQTKYRIGFLEKELNEAVKLEREAARAAKQEEKSAAEKFNQDRNRRPDVFGSKS